MKKYLHFLFIFLMAFPFAQNKPDNTYIKEKLHQKRSVYTDARWRKIIHFYLHPKKHF
jgi:hypothetical protein